MKAATVQVEGTRPDRSGYRADMHPVLVSYFAQEGLTDEQRASKLHISRGTLYTWRKRYPELAQALRVSKELADARVVMSLYQRALAGDVTSCTWWMKNRMLDKWRDRREVEPQTSAPAGKGMSVEEVTQRYADALKGLLEGHLGCTPTKRGGRTMTGVLVFRYGNEEVTVLPETTVVEEEQADERASGERSRQWPSTS